MRAAAAGDIALVQAMLERPDARITAQDANGDSAVDIATVNGHMQIVEELRAATTPAERPGDSEPCQEGRANIVEGG
eukprot:SAG31_NODE_4602_length_3103_cov_3.619174_3_plen_77_part_00